MTNSSQTLYLFIPFLLVLQGIYWYIGKRSAKKIKGSSDYFLAGKSVKSGALMMTFIGAQVGGGLVMGAADAAFEYGWWVLFYPLGVASGLFCLSFGMGKRLASFPVSTIAQILEIAYKSPLLKKIASSLSICSLFMILAAQFIASQKFLASLGIDSPLFFALFWGVIILYTVQGGLRAVISTDGAQATVFSVVFIGCFALLLFNGQGPTFPALPDTFSFPSGKLTGWLLMPLLYMMIEQDMGQRCLAATSSKAVSNATFGAGISTLLISIVPITFGVFAKTAGLTIAPGQSTLMTAIGYATSPMVSALAGCAILAAIISTASSLISAISSNLSQDFGSKSLKTARLLTLAIAVGALTFAFSLDNVVDVLIQSYELFISALFVPIVRALFKKRGNFISAFLAIIFGILSFGFFKLFPQEFPTELINIGISFAGYQLGELVTKRGSFSTSLP